MYTTIFLISIFSLTTASPLATPPPGKDQCGPTIQIAGDPPNTCFPATPALGGNPIFDITPLNESHNSTYDWHSCDTLIEKACTDMLDISIPNDKWKFYTTPSITDGKDTFTSTSCQLAWYVNGGYMEAPRPVENCRNIFGAIRDWGQESNKTPLKTWIGASINLKEWPSRQEGQWWSTNDVIDGVYVPYDEKLGGLTSDIVY
ncbi:MAG: hypothetical protein Q9174_002895 [Haloplaca sp. 1 TL-2023]